MIREYRISDKFDVVELLKLNTPQFFASEEEEDYSEYLDNRREDYFVVETEDEIIGAGGINYTDEGKTACISWDVFHPKVQGKGWGKELTAYRIGLIKQNPTIVLIRVRTAQMTHKFYAKCGFELKEVVPDYWAKGFDLYRMEIKVK